MATTDKAEWILLDTDLTTRLAIMPVEKSHLYAELSEPGSGELSIPLDSVAAGLVTSGMFCQCNYRGAARGGFFVDNISRKQADLSEGGGRWMSISGRGAAALLDDAIIVGDGTTSTSREYVNKTKAYILLSLIYEAQARGALSVLTVDFSSTIDSIGAGWTDSEDYSLNVGMSLFDLMRQFADSIDFDINLVAGSFVLSAYKAGKGSDKSETVYFRVGSNCEEVQSDEHGDNLKNAYLVAWQDGYTNVNDSASITLRRRRETMLDIKQAQTVTTATTYSAAVLSGTKDPLKNISIRIYDGVPPRLFEDYYIGDYITLDVLGVETKYRIYGIQADFDGVNYSNVVVEVNSIYRTRDLRMSRDLAWLKNQIASAHDAKKLAVSYWAGLGHSDDVITSINGMAVWGDKIIIVGNFTRIGGINANCIVVYDTVTGLFSGELGSGIGMGAAGRQIFSASVNGSLIYVGGYFAVINGVTASSIAYYDGAWHELGGGAYEDTVGAGHCNAILASGTDVYVAGTIAENPDGSGWTQCAKWDTVAGTWEDLTGANLIGYYADCALAIDGANVYLGGSASPYLKVWNGTTWGTVGASLGGAIHALTFANSYLYAGGDFAEGVKYWDGAAWNSLGAGLSGIVYGISVYLTDVYVVGTFTDVGNYIARFSGGGWSLLDTGLDNTATALTLLDNDVYTGGIFLNAGGKSALKLAAYFNNFQSLTDYLEHSSQGSFDMGNAIHTATASAVTDADEFPFWDDFSNALRKITWANTKATIKTYTDGLYVWLTGDQTIAGVKTFSTRVQVGIEPPTAGSTGAVDQTTEGVSAGHTLWTYGTTFASFITGVFANGTKASPTTTLINDVLMRMRGRAYDGTNYGTTEAEIRHVANENHTTSAHGARTEIWTTPDGSTTLTKALTVQADGNINIEAGKTYNVNGVPIGGSGGVASVTGDSVDNTDPINPVINSGNGDLVSPLISAEVSITGATTATISRYHVISGTSNYTVSLPATAGNEGKFIGGRITNTGITILDGNASETIDTVTTKRYFQGQSFLLMCDGSNWTDVLSSTAPRRAGIFMDEVIISASLIKTLSLSQRYTLYFFQNPAANGDTWKMPIYISAGSYTVTVLGVADANLGKLDWTLNGTSITTGQDWYAASTTYNVEKTFSLTVPYTGYHLLTATVNGKNASSTNYYNILTKVSIIPVVY